MMPVQYLQNYTFFAPGARVVNVSSVAGLLNNGIGMPENSIGVPDGSPWKEKLAKSGSDLTVSMMLWKILKFWNLKIANQGWGVALKCTNQTMNFFKSD